MSPGDIKHLINGMSVHELAAISKVLLPRLITVTEEAKTLLAALEGRNMSITEPLELALAALDPNAESHQAFIDATMNAEPFLKTTWNK